MNKHTRLRIESWCKKFCQIINNKDWKKNRNLHAICLLDMIINNRYEEPYNKFAPEGPLSQLSKSIVKSKMSSKFINYSKFTFNLPLSENNFINSNMNSPIKKKRPMTPDEVTFKNFNINKRNHFDEINKCNDPNLLKKFIEILQNKVNETKNIINKQNEEKKILLKKINQLESLRKSYNI